MRPVWEHASLDQLRLEGDPLADDVVKAIYETQQLDGVNELLRQLFTNSDPRRADLPPPVAAYFQESRVLPDWFDPERFERAQVLFHEYGWSKWLKPLLSGISLAHDIEHRVPIARQASHRLMQNLLKQSLDHNLGQHRASFSLPDHLTKSWKLDDISS